MERALTPLEAAVVGWLLDHAAMVDVAAYRLPPIEELRVVGGCDCGCTSVDFQTHKKGSRLIADAIAVYPDGQWAGLILWGREGRIDSLEVYDFHPESSHRFPEVEDLRSWSEAGEPSASGRTSHS